MQKTKLRILSMLNEGSYASKIAKALKLKDATISGHLKRLQKKGLIQLNVYSTSKIYHLTEQGLALLLEQAKPSRAGYEQAKPSKLQRPHAIQVNGLLFKTSWNRLEDTLASLSIPYHKELKGNLIRFNWKGRELRATSQWLYTIQELEEMPINVPIGEVLKKAMLEAAPLFEAFLGKTGLRCLRDRLGWLGLEVHYFENGYPGNEIAEEGLKDKNRTVYAYDLKTKQAKAWADSSLGDLKELETNSEIVDTQMKLFIQAVENRELKPYEDEIQTRRDIADITSLLKEYGEKLNLHLPILEGMKTEQEQARQERAINLKILKKILEGLNQGRL